jgi:beta-glucosidase
MNQEVSKILSKMSLEDKVALCSGKDFWHTKGFEKYGIPGIMVCDGPHGLRKQEDASDMLGLNKSVPSTCFPTAALSACSFDIDLLAKEGRAIAQEAAAEDVAVVLGPGACLKKNPLCGRNFEYFSEDPYLAGKLSAAFIRGVQENGVGTSLKHFACNNQETKRFSSDSVVDERTLRELYLTAFEIAVRESQPKTVMCSYNKINGTYSSDNQELLTKILRDEWGFEGLVVTDWGAMHDRTEGFRAGCDLMMPGGSAYGEKAAIRAVRESRLSESVVDKCAARVLELVLDAQKVKHMPYDKQQHHNAARQVAEGSIVLLKNEDSILPLACGEKVALIGKMAEAPRYQGAGSSHIQPTRLSCLKDAMPEAAYAPGCDERGGTTAALLAEAEAAAKAADKVVLVLGLTDAYESEGFDRETLAMPEGHLTLLNRVVKANPNTVVILCCGSVVETPWEDSVKGILYAGLSGQAGGEALANILCGRVNPSGRLAETWPVRYADCPSHSYFGGKDGQYREGLYVGYRYYEKANIAVRWPFGYGLSYTTFAYHNLKADTSHASVDVTNTGDRAGAEAVLCWIVSPQGGVYRPLRELRRFTKVFLQPGETQRVEFSLDDRCFAVWSNGWVVSGGTYTVEIGGQRVEFAVSGVEAPVPAWQKDSWYEHPAGEPSTEDWTKLIGFRYVEKKPVKGSYTMENTVKEMREHSLIMKIMYKAVEGVVAKGFGGKKDYDNPEFKMMMASASDCSISSSQINGAIKDGLMQGLVEMANGHFIRGIRRMICGE